MNNIKRETILKLVLIFSIIAILSAYFIQYMLGHQPCNLCLIERIPYISSIIIISAIFIFKKIEKILLIVLIIIFMSAFIMSLYHFGIEQGFIKESLVCDLDIKSDIVTKEDILNQLKQKTISCKDVTFKFLGFSLATINIFTSLILSYITLKIFLSYEKN